MYNYRSGTVNSESFFGKHFLRIKWNFELTVFKLTMHYKHEMIGNLSKISKKLRINRVQWRIQDFPKGGAPTSRSALIFQFCSRKLHENERIWTPRGGGARPWRPPPRSANGVRIDRARPVKKISIETNIN